MSAREQTTSQNRSESRNFNYPMGESAENTGASEPLL